MKEKFIDNNGVSIQYLIINYSPGGTPLIFIPGAIVGADSIFASIKECINFYCIIISIRGRGKSGKPVNGYTIEDQVSDIAAVINAEIIKELYIVGHSVGAGLAAAYTIKYPEKIRGLILADYPPAYPAFPEQWGNRIREHFIDMDENFINELIKDSLKTDFTDDLIKMKFKKLLLKGSNENSLLKSEKANHVCQKLLDAQLIIIENCGHEIFIEKPYEALKIVEKFMTE